MGELDALYANVGGGSKSLVDTVVVTLAKVKAETLADRERVAR